MKYCAVNELRNRLDSVNECIELACQSAGRKRNDVTLVVVTKHRPAHVVASLLSLGIKDIGENYVQEVIDKQAALDDISDNFRWHLIGPLQRRKAKYIPHRFYMMHSVDRLEVAQKLNDNFSGTGLKFPVLLQINVSGEESKSGFPLPEGQVTDFFLKEVEELSALDAVNVCGLMTMPPLFSDPEKSRRHYVQLHKLQDKLNGHLGKEMFSTLSMGTSFDYEVAIQEGATYVRIGEAILGMRDKNV